MAASDDLFCSHERPDSFFDLLENIRRVRCINRRTKLVQSARHTLKDIKSDLLQSYMRSNQFSPLFLCVVDLAVQPEFQGREHFYYEKEDFVDLTERVEAVLGFLHVFFDICIKHGVTNTLCIDNSLPKLLVIISSNIRTSLWTSESAQRLSLLVLNQLRILYKVDSLSELLLLNVKGACRDMGMCLLRQYLAVVREFLTKDKWQSNPTIVESFFWMLTNMIKFPVLSDYLDVVLPPALMFIDSHVVEHKVMGIHSLHHITANVTREELRWYGRADVIFAALKQQVYAREPEIVRVLHPALLVVLPVVDKDPAKPTSPAKSSNLDEILTIIITSAQMENALVLRRLYTACIADFVDILGICSVRHLKGLLSLVLNYLEVFDGPEEQARFNTLRVLRSLIKHCWPRMPAHASEVLKALLKLIQDTASDSCLTPASVKEQLKTEAVKCISLLTELCPEARMCVWEVCKTAELSYMTEVLENIFSDFVAPQRDLKVCS